jgi:nucleotide-binding universal stress UspA family protein
MTIAKILAVIDGGAGSGAVLESALRLGRDFAARVELLHVMIDPEEATLVLGEGITGVTVERMIESLRAGVEARAGKARALYGIHCVAAGLPVVEPDAEAQAGAFQVAYRQVTGREADEAAQGGRLSDLIVVAEPSSEPEGASAATLEAALFESGRPVLMIPATAPENLGERIAIAWDDTPEAARACGAALPLLIKAKEVYLLTGGAEDSRPKPSLLAAYLAHHGVTSKTWAFAPGEGPLGEEILGQAKQAGTDLLVMGAYGHSRLREMVLGGVTRSVIATAGIPILMAH